MAEQIETTGCARCGMRFGAGMPYLVGKTRTGWAGRCMSPECGTDFLSDTPLFVGTGVFPNDPWAEGDRDWFRINHKRQWRLRWPLPGEIEALAVDEQLGEQAGARHTSTHARGALRHLAKGGRIAVAVYQFEPGKRIRVPFGFISNDPPDSFTDAAVPALLSWLVAFVETQRVLLASDAPAAEEMFGARIQRRLEAIAKLTGGRRETVS